MAKERNGCGKGHVHLLAVCVAALLCALHHERRRVRVLVEQQHRVERELRRKAERDPLTQLLNKTAACQAIERILAEQPGRVHAFLIIDVDYFKRINDTSGHWMGDRVLTQCAEGLRGLFRSTDILGRVGGDELAVFCPGICSEEPARQRAEQICALFRTFSISCSVGVALFPRDGACFDDLYKNADKALYCAKEQGRDRYSLCVCGGERPGT